MEKVISKDGTSLAYDKVGPGPVVILVGGAFSYRAYPGSVKLAELLSKRFTVINYDRRGRGDSSDTEPYDVAVMGDTVKGGPLSAKEWESVSVPTLAIDGSRSPAVSRQVVDAVVAVLPNAQRRTLEGQSHDVSMDMLAPVLETFFQDQSSNEGRSV